MDAGRRALAVALGPGGQQGGAAARAPPETDLWVPGPGPDPGRICEDLCKQRTLSKL